MVYYTLAVLSYNSKDFDEALEYLNKAFSYYDRADDVLALRARTFLKLSKVKQAYEDASLAFLINPNNQDAIEIKKFLS
jgi:tetratricopeptide (TPR) repeat protein